MKKIKLLKINQAKISDIMKKKIEVMQRINMFSSVGKTVRKNVFKNS